MNSIWDEWTEPYTGHSIGWWNQAFDGYTYDGFDKEFIMGWFRLYAEVEIIEREK